MQGRVDMPEKDRYEVIKYEQIDGVPNFAHSNVIAVYDRIIDLGYFDLVFYNRTPTNFTARHFLSMFISGRYILYFLAKNKEIGAVCWIEPRLDKVADIHYTSLDKLDYPTLKQFGIEALKSILQEYNTLVGYAPKFNKPAMRFNKDIGMTRGGEIKEYCWLEKEKRYEDAVVFYTNRKIYQGE